MQNESRPPQSGTTRRLHDAEACNRVHHGVDLIKISLPYLLAIQNLDLIWPNVSRVV